MRSIYDSLVDFLSSIQRYFKSTGSNALCSAFSIDERGKMANSAKKLAGNFAISLALYPIW